MVKCYVEKLSNYINVSQFTSVKTYIEYRVIEEKDKTVTIVFEKTKNELKNKMYDTKTGLKIATPLFLKPYIGKKILIYTENVNSSAKELFRIKPIDFEIENKIGVRYKDPYFTSSSLIIPTFYINKYLDENASILRVSFVLTDDLIIHKGQIRAAFQLIRNQEICNYPLYKTTNGLKTKTMYKFLDLIDNNNKFLEKFIYVTTVPVSFNKYGVMIFKEDINAH
jgi:hypothetical protein